MKRVSSFLKKHGIEVYDAQMPDWSVGIFSGYVVYEIRGQLREMDWNEINEIMYEFGKGKIADLEESLWINSFEFVE